MAEPSESRSYREFVTRSVNEVQRGLKLDSFHPGSKKRKVHATLEAQQQKRPNRGAAERVIESRFALGGDDASYLASGIATLWSTVGEARDANEAELGLAPASLYAPDAVNGIRKGLLAALERKNDELRREAPRSLPKLLRALQVLLEQIDVTQTPGLKELLERGTVRTTEERTMLLTFLMRMRELLHPTQKDNLAQLILTKGRGQITQLVDRFEKEKAVLVAEHERRFAEAERRFDERFEKEQRLSGVRCTRRVGVEVEHARNLWKRNNELNGLLAQCEERLRARGAPPGDSSTDGAPAAQDDPNVLAQAAATVAGLESLRRQEQAVQDAEIAANPAAADALQSLAQPQPQPQQQQQQAAQDAEIAANPAAEAALQGIAQPQQPQQQVAQDAEIAANPEAAGALQGILGAMPSAVQRGVDFVTRGMQAVADAGPATTHTPGTTPPPSPPRSPPPPPPGPPPDDDSVSVAIGRETDFAAWQQQARATRDALELRVDTLAQQLKDIQAVVEADRRSMSRQLEAAINTQDNKLDALQKLVTGRSALLTQLRAQLSKSQKAHEELKARHAAQLDGLEKGVTTLEEAQRAFIEDVPKLIADLRAQIDARTADAEGIKKALVGLDSDVQAKAAKAVELQESNQELNELKAKLAALELAQDKAKAGIIQETRTALMAEVAKLRAEEEARAVAAEAAYKIERLHELQRVEKELEAVQGAVKKLEAGAASADVVETLRKDFGRLSGDFAPRQQAIDLNTTAMVRVKAEMGKLQSALQELKALEKSNYQKMIGAVAAAEGKATELESQVLELGKKIAQLKGDDADDDQTMTNLWSELNLLRKAAAERDEKLARIAREHEALMEAKALAGGADNDKRFGEIKRVLRELGEKVDKLADNQRTLQSYMAFDDQYESSDFMAHLMEFADQDDDSEIKQDLREMYQKFRVMLKEPETYEEKMAADLLNASIAEYEAVLAKARTEWEYKEQSGEEARKKAKAAVIKELTMLGENQVRLIKEWMRRPESNLAQFQNATLEEYEKAMLIWMGDGFAHTRQKLENRFPDDNHDASYDGFIGASSSDAWTVPFAVYRGLVGQRGPTEPACASECPTDALLPYNAPNLDAFVRHALPVKRMLAHSPDPTEEDVAEALKGCAPHAADSPADVGEALALLQDDFAITGVAPASELEPKRCGVEVPHEVRWLPQGPRAGTMCRVAVLEHAAARCAQVANQADVAPEVARALRDAALSLKLQQLAPLYALNEAAEFADAPHPLGTKTKLVTRPCAIVRGTLSFPTDAGIARAPEEGAEKRDADLSKAMNELAVPTATLRNRLRRSGEPANVYVAPSPDALGFHPAPTSATGADSSTVIGATAASEGRVAREANAARVYASLASEAVTQSDYGPAMWRRVVNRAIVAAAAIQPTSEFSGTYGQTAADAVRGVQRNSSAPCVSPDVVSAFLDANKSDTDGAGAVTARSRRHGLWTEMLRHLAISQDRLWVFVRLMSGGIGGDVQEVITMADAATLKAAKAIQDQRVEIAKRVSDMQSKIVETVVASMLKKSEMTMSLEDDTVAVIDAEAKKKLQELASGTSGRPFFEANVALKNLTERNENPPRLQDVLNSLANVGAHMQTTLEQSLAEPGAASASLVELSHPSNSYFVSMRPDAIAAIRSAHEMLNSELGVVGGRRRLALWELVEGGCQVLTHRFAELCGFLLVQTRTSTGVSAMYVSAQSIHTNASQARVALAKLVAAASAYIARVSPPVFDAPDSQAERWRVLAAGERVTDLSITAQPRSVARAPLFAPISSSGWVNIGGRRY
jgi:hypothetical protein